MTEEKQKSGGKSPDGADTSEDDIWAELEAADTSAEPEDRETFQQAEEEPTGVIKDQEEAGKTDDKAPDDSPPADLDDKDKPDDLDPAALKDQRDRLEKQFRSEQNRSIGQQRRADRLQKNVDTLEKELAEFKARLTAKPDEAELDTLKKLREEYPDLAEPLASKIEALEADRKADLSKRTADLESRIADSRDEIEDIEAAEEAKILEEHPDGFKVIADHPEEFITWVNDQPAEYREIYERNRQVLKDGSGAALLISAFKEHRAGRSEQHEEVDEQTETGNRLKTKRQRQLQGAQSVRTGKSTKIITGEPTGDMSEEEAWDYWERKDKERSA